MFQTGVFVASASRVTSLGHAQDEIDRLNIFYSLWRRNTLIISVGILCAAFGACYACLITPVYEVSAVLRPVAFSDLYLLN